jgi:DNA-binding transcriptional ArsR family regulator
MSHSMSKRHLSLLLDDKAKTEVVSFMQEAERRRAFRVRRRGNAVLLSNQGWTMQQISRQFKVSLRTVRNWLHRFRQAGVVGFI